MAGGFPSLGMVSVVESVYSATSSDFVQSQEGLSHPSHKCRLPGIEKLIP